MIQKKRSTAYINQLKRSEYDAIRLLKEKIKEEESSILLYESCLAYPQLKVTENGEHSKELLVPEKEKDKYNLNSTLINELHESIDFQKIFLNHNIINQSKEPFQLEDDFILFNLNVSGEFLDLSYRIEMVTRKTLENEKIDEIKVIKLSKSFYQLNDFVTAIIDYNNLSTLFHGYQRLLNLIEERDKTADQLADYPDVIIEGKDTETFIFTIQYSAEHEIIIKWNFKINVGYKGAPWYSNDIRFTYPKEDSTYLKKKECYAYLKNNKTVNGGEALISIVEELMNK